MSRNGGFGEHVSEFYKEIGSDVQVMNIALPDAYIEHGNVEILKKECGIDAETIAKRRSLRQPWDFRSGCRKGAQMKERLDVLLVRAGHWQLPERKQKRLLWQEMSM